MANPYYANTTAGAFDGLNRTLADGFWRGKQLELQRDALGLQREELQQRGSQHDAEMDLRWEDFGVTKRMREQLMDQDKELQPERVREAQLRNATTEQTLKQSADMHPLNMDKARISNDGLRTQVASGKEDLSQKRRDNQIKTIEDVSRVEGEIGRKINTELANYSTPAEALANPQFRSMVLNSALKMPSITKLIGALEAGPDGEPDKEIRAKTGPDGISFYVVDSEGQVPLGAGAIPWTELLSAVTSGDVTSDRVRREMVAERGNKSFIGDEGGESFPQTTGTMLLDFWDQGVPKGQPTISQLLTERYQPSARPKSGSEEFSQQERRTARAQLATRAISNEEGVTGSAALARSDALTPGARMSRLKEASETAKTSAVQNYVNANLGGGNFTQGLIFDKNYERIGNMLAERKLPVNAENVTRAMSTMVDTILGGNSAGLIARRLKLPRSQAEWSQEDWNKAVDFAGWMLREEDFGYLPGTGKKLDEKAPVVTPYQLSRYLYDNEREQEGGFFQSREPK